MKKFYVAAVISVMGQEYTQSKAVKIETRLDNGLTESDMDNIKLEFMKSESPSKEFRAIVNLVPLIC